MILMVTMQPPGLSCVPGQRAGAAAPADDFPPRAKSCRQAGTTPEGEPMQSHAPHPGLDGWQRFIGRWETQATHPLLPGAVVRGHARFEWLDGRQFVIVRWHYDHPEIPDAIAITGVTDGQLSMHYFDYRGVYRVCAVSLDDDQWRFWRDAPGFSQRFTGILSDDGNTITGQGQLSRDGSSWQDDLAITYRKSPPAPGPPPRQRRQAGNLIHLRTTKIN
jgi:hypothetical protein